MKVKTLLKTLKNVAYVLQSDTGFSYESGYIGDGAVGEFYSDYSNFKVVSITTVRDCDKLFITIKA